MSNKIVKEIKTILDAYPRISLFSDMNRLKLARLIHESLNTKKLLNESVSDTSELVETLKRVAPAIDKNISELAPESVMVSTSKENETLKPEPKVKIKSKVPKPDGHSKPGIRPPRPSVPKKSDRNIVNRKRKAKK